MICIKCGAEISDKAKFCMNCGNTIDQAKLDSLKHNENTTMDEIVIHQNMSDEEMNRLGQRLDYVQKEQEKQAEKNGTVFYIANQKLVLSKAKLDLIKIINRAKTITDKTKLEFKVHYNKEVTTFVKYIDQDEYIRDLFINTIRKISSVSSNTFKRCSVDEIGSEFESINGGSTLLQSQKNLRVCLAEKERLEEQLQNIGGLLNLQKETRGRVVGYGRGISGLLKASIESSIINAGIGGAYDIKNGIKMNSLKNKCTAELNAFVKKSETKNILLRDFNSDMDNLLQAFMNAICDKNSISDAAFNIDCSEENVEEMQEQAEKVLELNGDEQYVFLLEEFPWNEKIYIDIFEEYGDDNNDLTRYADLFNMKVVERIKKEKDEEEKEKIRAKERKIQEKKRKQEEKEKQEKLQEERKKKEKYEKLRKEREVIRKLKEEIDCRIELETQLEALSQKVEMTGDIREQYDQVEQEIQKYATRIKELDYSSQVYIRDISKLEEKRNQLQRDLDNVGLFERQKKKSLKSEIDNLFGEEVVQKQAYTKLQNQECQIKEQYERTVKRRDGLVLQHKTNVENKKKEVVAELNKYYSSHIESFHMINSNEISFGRKLWRVLDHHGSQFLLIDKSILVVPRRYEESDAKVTWATCSLRGWLNSEYYSEFEEQERTIICETKLEESDDSVFILNANEAQMYFESDQDRIADINKRNQKWWLRSSGEPKRSTDIVCADGKIGVSDTNNSARIYVRPVIKIDFSLSYNDEKIQNKYSKLFDNDI